MRVLGIDPGSRVTGYGVVDARGTELDYVASGCIRTRARLADGDGVADHLGEIYRSIDMLIGLHQPSVVAIEQVFVAHNVASALKLGQARGAALAAVVANHVPVAEYAARRVKQAVTGTGAAAKSQVQHMVRLLLNLNAPPSNDAADALAIAICHLHGASALAQGIRRTRRRR